MLTGLRRALSRVWRWSRKGRDERRSVAARERFWSEVRAGERDAEAASAGERSIRDTEPGPASRTSDRRARGAAPPIRDQRS